MTQNRKPPAYLEYAASMMAQKAFRFMSLEARGLLYSIRLECWENHRVPSNPEDLAKWLHFPPDQIERALPQIAPFIEFVGNELRCPDLDDYRAQAALPVYS